VSSQTSSGATEIPTLGPEAYRRWRASELGRITESLERSLMLSLVGDVAGCRLLDIGCGDGDFALELGRRGAAVTGVDMSPAMIEAARRHHAGRSEATFQVAKATELPFANGSFDVVVAMTILCFVADAAPAFREIARVLRPGGRLVIGELGKWSTWAAERRLRAWLGSPLWRRGHFRTPAELQRLAREAGLAPGPVRGAVFYPRLALAARWMRALEPRLGSATTLGAAFLGMPALKPAAS